MITWGVESELIHLMASTGRDDRGAQVTCFLLPKETPGVKFTRMPDSMGCRGMHHYIVDFDDCELSEDAVLGDVGQGLDLVLRGFMDIGRLMVAISGVGVAKRAIELAVAFSKQRTTFGAPIATRQAVKLILAEMESDAFAVNSAVAATAAKYDSGDSITADAAMCKLLAVETVARVTDRCLRVHGGVGYTSAHKVERHYRDARAMWFEEGTIEIQKIVVADQLLRNGSNW